MNRLQLLENSINLCLKEWRPVFINPLIQCRMQWPNAAFLTDIMIKLRHSLQFRDVQGICLIMLEADPAVTPLIWLQTLLQMAKDTNYPPQEFISLMSTVAAQVTESYPLSQWRELLCYQDLTIQHVSALRHKIIVDQNLIDLIIAELPSALSLELCCHFSTHVSSEILLLLESHLQQAFKDMSDIARWRLPIETFASLAELTQKSNNRRFQAYLCGLPQYQSFIAEDRDLIIAAAKLGMYVPCEDPIKVCKSILCCFTLTSDMVKVAYQLCPQTLLNELYNPKGYPQVSNWYIDSGQFMLAGLLQPLICFTKDDFDKILDNFPTEISEALRGDLREHVYTGPLSLDGNINNDSTGMLEALRQEFSDSPVTHARQQLTRIFASDHWYLDPLILQLYHIYEQIITRKLGKKWNALIELLRLFSEVEVHCLPYSGLPTTRSYIIINNLRLDILCQVYPSVVLTRLNAMSKDIYWRQYDQVYNEFYAEISEDTYSNLEAHETSFLKLGLSVEDLAVRKAEVKFAKMEKSLTRQVSRKGADYVREAKWQEILDDERAKLRRNRFRLTVKLYEADILDKLSALTEAVQIQHLRDICYIHAGYDAIWTSQKSFVYTTKLFHIPSTLTDIMTKCGFQITTDEDKVVVMGVYNGHYYFPVSTEAPEAMLDQGVVTTLEPHYSKQLLAELCQCVTDVKLRKLVGSHLKIILMRARTQRKDGHLQDEIIDQIKSLLSNISTNADIKVFRQDVKEILPEYQV